MVAPTRFFTEDTEGNAKLLDELAHKMDRFAEHVVERARAHAPFGQGVHPLRSKKKRPLLFHYRDTIKATTYLYGEVFLGKAVRTPGFSPSRWAICSVVYTTATPWGHIYEVTGAGPHKIPGTIGAGGHPGVARRPHFVIGLFEAVADAGLVMRGNVSKGKG